MRTRAKNGSSNTAKISKKARLYHLEEATIRQIDVLAALYGGKEKAIAGAVDATYRAARDALKRMKVRVPSRP